MPSNASRRSRAFGEPNYAYTHNGDDELLKTLGLSTGPFRRDWTDIGTACVQEAQVNEDDGTIYPAATVKVEVAAYPAQFWRFTIERPNDRYEGEGQPPVEQLVMRTGSGGFTDYWPMAEAVARNMVNLEAVERA